MTGEQLNASLIRLHHRLCPASVVTVSAACWPQAEAAAGPTLLDKSLFIGRKKLICELKDGRATSPIVLAEHPQRGGTAPSSS